jgi:hypothetical protein
MITRANYFSGVIVGLAVGCLWLIQASADVQVGEGFQPEEAVESIRVQLNIAPGGEDLDEPIALDLGLGFPLWLHRLGRVESPTAPFGAVCERGADAHAVRAGQSATFEFSMTGPAGQDDLRTSPQLLAGVRVSDISRVGFTSKAEHGWIIASYRIEVNGRPFVSNNSVSANGRGMQDAARERLMELDRDSGAQQAELNNLRALVGTGLATSVDRARLAELDKELAPQLVERMRIDRQLRGAAPFYLESDFQPQWRRNGTIERVKVTVVTAPHSGADTRNYVYFRIGGHKYLLGSPLYPLSPDYGPQEFELDLSTAPLTASDLRGYALGMLAHHETSAEAPDRWHPQRLIVEIDGRNVYDSDENPIDRSSLATIRIIPPAQVNTSGKVVENVPVSRETCVWEAGSGIGLDLINGGPEELPAVDDPAYPDPEPSFSIEQNIAVNEENWYDSGAGPFPGEIAFDPSWEPGWGPGWGPGWDPGWGPGLDPGWGPGWIPGPSPLDLIVAGILEELGLLPDWVIPPPVGAPPQLEQVDLDLSTQTVSWIVTGDETQIDHFIVQRQRLLPDLDVPLDGELSEPLTLAASERSISLSSLVPILTMESTDLSTRSYSAIRVTLVPTDPAIGVDPGLSPAIPRRAMEPGTSLHLDHHYDFAHSGFPASPFDVSPGGEPIVAGHAVWAAGEIDSHTGLVFAGVSPLQHHVVARPESAGDMVRVHFHSDVLPPGSYRVIAFVGFQGAVESPAEVDVHSSVRVSSVMPPGAEQTYVGTCSVSADPLGPPAHMMPLITDLATADVGPGPMTLTIRYRFNNVHVDPQHPPMLVGVRLLSL